MSEMVERTARAILAYLRKDGWDGDAIASDHPIWLSVGDGALDLDGIARAAIEAMREPTAAMVDYAEVPERYDYGGLADDWRNMIDAALKP